MITGGEEEENGNESDIFAFRQIDLEARDLRYSYFKKSSIANHNEVKGVDERLLSR